MYNSAGKNASCLRAASGGRGNADVSQFGGSLQGARSMQVCPECRDVLINHSNSLKPSTVSKKWSRLDRNLKFSRNLESFFPFTLFETLPSKLLRKERNKYSLVSRVSNLFANLKN